ncbi:MAG: TlpA family protein disulfide reductase [Muribaculaceae bacterium]|nr:TlpA family protein disulfide reductase [Muribaculaceae bacterium]
MIRQSVIFASMALISTMGLYASGECAGQLSIEMPSSAGRDKVIVVHTLLDDMLANRRDTSVFDTITITNGIGRMALDPAGPAYYRVTFDAEDVAHVYAAPGENLTLKVTAVTPLHYSVAGTPLMEGITEYNDITLPLEQEFEQITASGQPSAEAIADLTSRYDSITNDFVKKYINSPAVVYALMNVRGQEFLDLYDAIGPDARTSILMPFVEAKRPGEIKQAEAERFQQSLSSGQIEAPAFTFPDLEGKAVSLSDFRGQWVVLDFWGSWCGWCIKGFPKLKEAYRQADGRFRVIGIDCRDSEANWRAAVDKYKLPWVNVYNGDPDSAVLRAYGVTGFPTKAIINPEGKLVDLTVGEDPAFYDKLAKFIAE